MTTCTIIVTGLIIVILFGIYWHALKISQKLTKCLGLLEKMAEKK